MMRTVQHLITGLLVLHGAIHVLGLLKWGRLAPVPQLSGRTLVPLADAAQRVFAGFWAGALVLLVVAAALRLLQRDAWWAPALAGITLSQVLIVMSWPDAKLGTLLNVLLVVPAVVEAAHFQFARRVDREIRSVLADAEPAPARNAVRSADLVRLPAPVGRWLETAGVVGRLPAQTVRLLQRGELRTAPDAAWLPATAEQHFTVVPPAFVWRVDTTMFGFLPVSGRDVLAHGRGEMLIKAGSLFSIVRAADEKIDHGATLRFLGEMVWFPSAALAPYVVWEAIDQGNARASMNVGRGSVSAVFHFDEAGRVLGLDAERYLGGGAAAKLTPWSVTCSKWGRFQGILMPVRGEVSWSLPGGPFTYYRWEILHVEFDGSEPLDTSPDSDARWAEAAKSSPSVARGALP